MFDTAMNYIQQIQNPWQAIAFVALIASVTVVLVFLFKMFARMWESIFG